MNKSSTEQDDYTAKISVGHPFRTILRYNLPYAREYLLGAALSLAFVIMEQATPLVMRAVVKHFESGRMTWGILVFFFSILLTTTLLAGVARFWERTLIIRASRKFEFDLRNDFFRHLEKLSLDFFRKTSTGDIIARATNDMNYVRLFLGPGVMGTVDMVRIPIVIALMAYFNSHLTLLGLSAIPVISFAVYFMVMYMHRQSQRVQAQFSSLSTRAQENLAGARIVKAYNAANRETEMFREESTKYMRESLRLSYVMALIWPAIELALGLVVLLVIWRGGIMVIRKVEVVRPAISFAGLRFYQTTFTFADFTGFIVCLIMLSFPITQLGWVLSLYQRGAASMNRILEIMGQKPTISDTPTAVSPETIHGRIVFDRVSFAYAGNPVLKDISFTVFPGETVAIVGPTGSGKSTLVSLICREYDPTNGRILLDDTDLRDISLKTLRKAIGYSPQDVFLFSETIAENLRFSKPDATPDELTHVCRIAQLTQTISELPQGLDTLLGERGINLSGGQKQRLALARAVLRDPRVLILDDALSSVDTHTEEEILQGLKGIFANRTSIIISHRISTIKHADKIIVLDAGQIVQQGTHEELCSVQGVYAQMYRRQVLEQRIEET